MPRVSDLLYRFRPSGAPGSATRAGVPADRARDLAEELEPVFAALAQTQGECGQLVEGGRLRAAQIRARDAAEVESLLATVAARASAARASACAAAQAVAADVGAHEDRRTQEEVARLRDRADRLLPQLQSEVAASVRALLGPQPPGDLAAEATEATP